MATEIGEYLPDVNFPSIGNFVTYLILFVLFCVLVGFGLFMFIKRLKFNNRIVIFEKIGNSILPTKKDRAMEVKHGEGGDTVFVLKKNRKTLPVPNIQTGKRNFWYFVRDDGEWINIGIEDINEKMREMKINFLDKEMRYARVALQKNLKDRYVQPSFWEKYAGFIAYITLIAVVGIMMWLLFDRFMEIGSSLTRAIDAAGKVQDSSAKILSSLDNVCGGSKLVPAG